MSVQEVVINAPEDEVFNEWLIENQQSLQEHSDDWTNAIPGKRKMDFSENSLFHPLPAAHYRYDEENYPSIDN